VKTLERGASSSARLDALLDDAGITTLERAVP